MKHFRNPSKLVSVGKLIPLLRRAQKRGQKIVFTNGCFDLLHVGHVRTLSQARSLGDILVVGLNRDASVRSIKSPGRPVVGEKQRAEVLGGLTAVDHIVLFSDKTPLKLIRALKPDLLVKGADWKKKNIVGGDYVESYGGKVRPLPLVKGFSTTALIDKIKRAY